MSGDQASFPVTRHSIVRAAQSGDPDLRRQGFDALIAAYWKPVYMYLRRKWRASDEDARDLTQEFFARTFEKGFFDRYDPARARFRTYLRTCLDGFAMNARKAESRLKRGGGVSIVPLEFETAEGELRQHDVASGEDLDAYFDREFVRSLMELAVARGRARAVEAGRLSTFTIFDRYDVQPAGDAERPTYAALAREVGVSTSDVTNALVWARRELRAALFDVLRSVSASEQEFRDEAETLFARSAFARRRGAATARRVPTH
jgi:RNA polymerase sigma factor (sigma-70 family)